MSQRPQFRTSVWRFTHDELLHTVFGAPHDMGAEQLPVTHTCPRPHWLFNAPQLAGSVWRFTQRPIADVSPGRHAHWFVVALQY